ncbi:MAG: M48 family metallopeptidase [Myxococcota bacterium]|nr:M48 family metallopeptidase [Myxococcota bacterium]
MAAVAGPAPSRRVLGIVGLWLGFWIVGLLILCALLSVGILETHFTGSVGVAGVFCGLLALVVGWSLLPRWWFVREGPRPPALSPEAHGPLLEFVNTIADQVGARRPQAVNLTLEASAFASEQRTSWSLRRRPTVGLGLPLLAFLSPDELAAVLAHEYGHHLGGDTRFGAWMYRTRLAIAAALEGLDDSAFLLDVPFRAYGQMFLRTSRAWSRQQELAADALAARTRGAEVFAAALRKVEALAPRWESYQEHDVLPHLASGTRVALLEGFRRFLATRRRRPEVQRSIDERASRPSSEWDTHPAFAERLAALGLSAQTPEDLSDGANSLTLLGGEAAAEEAWYSLTFDAPLNAVGWDQLAQKVIFPGIAEALEKSVINPGTLGGAGPPSCWATGCWWRWCSAALRCGCSRERGLRCSGGRWRWTPARWWSSSRGANSRRRSTPVGWPPTRPRCRKRADEAGSGGDSRGPRPTRKRDWRLPPPPGPGIFRRLMRRLLSLLAVTSLTLLACKSPCRQLSEKLCDCAPNTVVRDSCRTAAGQEEARVRPSDEQQATCQALLTANQCDCHNLDSLEAKQACGLAR